MIVFPNLLIVVMSSVSARTQHAAIFDHDESITFLHDKSYLAHLYPN